MEKEEKINFAINDGETFYANEISISFGPAQFSLDFKNISPRIDARSQDGTKTFALKHNVVILDPTQTKNFVAMLSDIVSRYEKQFGKINVPKQTKSPKGKPLLENKPSRQIPSYFG
jgi:hypothetical protein